MTSPTATTWRAIPTRPRRSKRIFATARPQWASAITGLTVARSRLSRLWSGAHKRTFFRLGYGFSRQRNGAANMHAALCIPAVTGAWAHEGGGALHAIERRLPARQTLIEGLDARDDSVRGSTSRASARF